MKRNNSNAHTEGSSWCLHTGMVKGLHLLTPEGLATMKLNALKKQTFISLRILYNSPALPLSLAFFLSENTKIAVITIIKGILNCLPFFPYSFGRTCGHSLSTACLELSTLPSNLTLHTELLCHHADFLPL